MTPEQSQPAHLEIAHVLFMDIVGWSRLPMEEQSWCVEQLNALVRDTNDFRRAQAGRALIQLPSGDGMALVFFGDPEAPVRCALALTQKLSAIPRLQLRMGVHSGPVYRVRDIRDEENVTGGGVNIAQRVMDAGDAGHILVSRSVADILGQLTSWEPLLHDIGECEVKHGVRVHLFNLYSVAESLGNPALPAKVQGQRAMAAPPPAVPPQAVPPVVLPPVVSTDAGVPAATSPAVGTERAATAAVPVLGKAVAPGQVVLLYKRHVQPDEYVLKLLETHLGALGHKVFIDRHLSVGVEWAKEIERQVREADAVIPILSTSSMASEMLGYEVQIAHDACQKQNGKPRLLPVRIGYEGPLPESMAAILDPLEYALWAGPQDDQQLVTQLAAALDQHEAPAEKPMSLAGVCASPQPALELEAVGGAVPLDSKFYIVRPTDAEFLSAVARGDSLVLVKGARQMGKTSLLARGLQQAREAGARVVLTDFQWLNTAQLESPDSLFRTLAECLADQLDLDTFPDEVWKPGSGPSVNFQRYVRREVLGQIGTSLVWGLDEVDRLFTCDFGSEVFALFRSWHNARALDPAGPWSRLTLAIGYATEAHLFITDLNQSPFNVGTRLTLSDFTFEQVADLNARYGSPLNGEAEIARFYRLISGHPYLVRRALNEMASHHLDLPTFEAQADRDEGIFGDHLRRILVLLAKDPELLEVVRGCLRGRPCPGPESFYRLRSAGLMLGDSPRDARFRCQLYADYLERHLL